MFLGYTVNVTHNRCTENQYFIGVGCVELYRMQTTNINWNDYVDETEEYEERAAKDEGDFAIVSVGPVNGDDFYKLHIGLESGQIFRSDGLSLTQANISQSDLDSLVSVVGPAF